MSMHLTSLRSRKSLKRPLLLETVKTKAIAPGCFSPGKAAMELAEVARPGCTSDRYSRLVRLPLSSALQGLRVRHVGLTP